MIGLINFLNSINLGRLRLRAEVSGWMVIFILLLDIHRFGAWYTGNQCHMKGYGIAMLLVAGMPFVVYTAALTVQKIISKGWYMALYIFRIYLFFLVPGMLNPITIKTIFKEQVWYSTSVFRPVDFAFVKGVVAMLLLAGAYTAVFTGSIWIVVQVIKLILRVPLVQRIISKQRFKTVSCPDSFQVAVVIIVIALVNCIRRRCVRRRNKLVQVIVGITAV